MSDHTEATIRASSDNCGAGPDCRICRDVRPLLRLLDEARAERDALAARLALAEKLLTMLCRDVDWYMLPSLTAEARAYLAFREKEEG